MVLAGAVYAAILYVLFALLPADLLGRGESDAGAFAWLQVADDGVLAAVGLAFGRGRYPRDWRALGFRSARFGWLGLGALGGLLAAAAAWGVGVLLGRWGFTAPLHPVEAVLEEAHGLTDVGLVLLTVALVVPFAEEVFFRGFAYRVLRARLGVRAGAVVTTAGFALVHGLVPGAWLPVVPVGLVLVVLVERSGSLWPAVVAHAAVNALAILVP